MLIGWLRHWWAALGAVALGLGFLYASWDLRGGEAGTVDVWLEAVFANVGSAFVLIAPIAWITERLTRQVEDVRENVEEVRVESAGAREDVRRVREETSGTISELRREVASLREFGEQVRSRRAADAVREVGLYRRLGLDEVAPDRDDVINALRIAKETGVVDAAHGPRAELVPGHGDFLQLVLQERESGMSDVFFDILTRSGEGEDSVRWDEGVSATDVMSKLDKALRSAGINPEFDPDDWFKRISETLVVGASHIERHRIIELCPPQWAVTSDGIVPYPDRPLDGLGPQGIRSDHSSTEVKRKDWVDPDSFDNAVYSWRSLFPGPIGPWTLGIETGHR